MLLCLGVKLSLYTYFIENVVDGNQEMKGERKITFMALNEIYLIEIKFYKIFLGMF